MKHKPSIITLLLLFFVLAQVIGLGLINYDAQVGELSTDNQTLIVEFSETAAGPRPELSGVGTIIYLAVGIGIATIVLLGLIKLKFGGKLWKVWYFLAVTTALTIAFGVLIPSLIAIIVAVLLAGLKIWKYNFYTHNLTELFMYAGLAVLLVPLLSVFWAIILLVLISLYDAYAVWKSKHMVKLAQFTSKQELFAGLAINYAEEGSKIKTKKLVSKKEAKKKSGSKVKLRQAILGGGDIIFPLLFMGAVLIWLLQTGFTKLVAFSLSLIVLAGVTTSLALLFIKGKKDKFYPAMPFLTAGCLAGYGVLLLVLLFL
ncbi:hypothetical protein K9M74_01965 [Candidatus Woesearchaeota archaeon]|nr:hypothetical protein [Candidatus Woesearchaeota archaeon]